MGKRFWRLIPGLYTSLNAYKLTKQAAYYQTADNDQDLLTLQGQLHTDDARHNQSSSLR